MTGAFSGTFRLLSGRFVPEKASPRYVAPPWAASPPSTIFFIALFVCALMATATFTGSSAAASTDAAHSTTAATPSATKTSEPNVAATAAPKNRKVVTVAVKSASATYGVLKKWRWSSQKGRYIRVGKPIRAYVGEDGVGQASEYVSRTPAGVFTLTEAFGWRSDPGTRLPYRQVDYSSWWVSDVSSPHYNTYRECSPGAWCGFSQARSEQLGAISLYSHAVVIDYNRDPIVPGAGSAFFLHVSEGKPTQGCISINEVKLVALLKWLDPKKKPVISIGVGRSAYAAVGR